MTETKWFYVINWSTRSKAEDEITEEIYHLACDAVDNGAEWRVRLQMERVP